MNFLCCNFCGWRKASKCKKLIEDLRERIEESKKRRDSIITHLHAAVLQLVKNGQDQHAKERGRQLLKDQNRVDAYERLDHSCGIIMNNLGYIRRSRDCPFDINEAASSLIYASARCGELSELPKLRKLFGERYGKGFEIAAVELHPGNPVNRCLIQNLSIKSESEVDEWWENYCLEMETDIIDSGKQQPNDHVESPEQDTIIGASLCQLHLGFGESDHRIEKLVSSDDETSSSIWDTEYAFYYDDELHTRRNKHKSFLFDNSNELSPEELRFEEMGCDFQSQKTNDTTSRELCTRETNPWKNKNLRPPYMLPPSQRQKRTPVDEFVRSVSFQSQRDSTSDTSSSSSSSSHIHPKLPDYDDLVTKFVAIKRQHSGSPEYASSSSCTMI